MGPPEMFAKETKIDEDFNIPVYAIRTDTKEYLSPYRDIKPFTGWREDTIYRIDNGRFVITVLCDTKRELMNLTI